MRLIIDTESSDDWVLAVRAAKSFLDRAYDSKVSIIAYEDGRAFLVRRTKTGVSVTKERRA